VPFASTESGLWTNCTARPASRPTASNCIRRSASRSLKPSGRDSTTSHHERSNFQSRTNFGDTRFARRRPADGALNPHRWGRLQQMPADVVRASSSSGGLITEGRGRADGCGTAVIARC
jgi:hypothetical protein